MGFGRNSGAKYQNSGLTTVLQVCDVCRDFLMNRLRLLIALMMATLWLPVTQHCGLEAAGLLSGHCAEDGTSGCEADGACAMDGCGMLESGEYRSDGSPLTLASPHWFVCVYLMVGRVVAPEPEPDVGKDGDHASDRARDWFANWQFERRAAAPARAPDLSRI